MPEEEGQPQQPEEEQFTIESAMQVQAAKGLGTIQAKAPTMPPQAFMPQQGQHQQAAMMPPMPQGIPIPQY